MWLWKKKRGKSDDVDKKDGSKRREEKQRLRMPTLTLDLEEETRLVWLIEVLASGGQIVCGMMYFICTFFFYFQPREMHLHGTVTTDTLGLLALRE